jgi:Putative beta-barrel porin-2, OmpL-like. bbp2
MTRTITSLHRFSTAAALALVGLSVALTQPMQAEDKPATPPPPTAATPTPTPAPAPKWYDDISVNGFLSATYGYNLNRPDSGTNQFRTFDFDDNSFKVDVFTLTLQKAVAKPEEVGFRVDVSAGASLPKVESSYGLLQGQDVDVKQAFVSYIAPLGSGLRIDVGKAVTHFSYEYIESWDTPNDNVTHSFSFGYAIPFTHTGLKASYSFSDQVAGMVMLANGWDNVKDNNSSKTIGGQLTWTPTKTATVAFNLCTGPERTNVNSDPRTVVELTAQVKLSDLTVLGLDALYGSEKGAVVAGQTASWSGIAGYARLGVTDKLAFCLRGEYFADSDGARTRVAQKLKELTVTPEFKISSHLILRADLRVDWSDVESFEKKDGKTSKTQPTGILNAIYLF